MCAQKEREDRSDEEEGDQGHDLLPAGGGGGISAGVHAKISAREVRGEHSHGHNQGESRVRRRRDVQVHRCLTSDIYICIYYMCRSFLLGTCTCSVFWGT